MEDGVKEDKTQQKAAKFDGKAGWIKKSYGKFLGTYKDRYIQLEKTQLLVYENDEEKTCIETVDLESYDKCHELRSAFKKKNRIILIRAAKPVNKVHDIKFQAPSPEEKEAWIKALCDGINRAKNKIFDQVKVEGCSLEHVTRTRPKMQQSRRPPTRIHMKELATSSSDGILRLDLDIVDNTPNGNHPVPNDTAALSTETADEDSAPPPKKIFKPPMPPSKENKPNPEETEEESEDVETVKLPTPPTKPNNTSKDTVSEHSSPPSPPKKVLKPPMPPSKLKKPSAPATDEETEDAPAHSSLPEDTSEPPTPPTKPSSPSEDKPPPSTPSKGLKPVMPSKENKPSPPAGGTEDSAEVPAVAQEGTPEPLSKEIQPTKEEAEDVPVNEVSTIEETVQLAKPPPKPKDLSPETVKNNSAPHGPPKKKPLLPPKVNASIPPETNKVSADATPAKEVMKPLAPKENITSPPAAKEKIEDTPVSEEVLNPPEPMEDVLLSPEPEASSVTPSPGDPVPPPKIMVEDEEGQLKDGAQSSNSEDESDNGDISASTTALNGSRENLDEESSEDPADTPENTEQSLKEGDPAAASEELKHEIIQDANRTSLDGHHRQRETKKRQLDTRPPVPLKYVSKVKCASLGDLLSESKVKVQNEPLQEPSLGSEISILDELQNNIALELEKTEAFLQEMSEEESLAADGSKGTLAGKSSQKEELPEEILNKAVEKLRQANEVLQKAKNIKENKTEKNKRRKSC